MMNLTRFHNKGTILRSLYLHSHILPSLSLPNNTSSRNLHLFPSIHIHTNSKPTIPVTKTHLAKSSPTTW
jgi:hypothetical protein